MGKKLKTGKARRDKFYQLAKETGYRSRSAFKLIQLNRKFQFLQRARALVDLCAAPGGWLQVASKFMPVSSLIIGVDLVPIKPIPNVITFQEDITTEKCRQALKKELHTWKADVVLNDGAPNVGANWIHDAFSQAHLTLMALRLACESLSRGGWFITKVFRSQDYQPLLWILRQFFGKVQATKPQASRNESAEIFVVCQGYTAPDKIDSKFFDPKYAFKQVEVPAKTVRDLVTAKKPKAEGYTEGDYTLYHSFTLTEFIKAQNACDFLDKANEITFDRPDLERHRETTPEIRECCKDIRVLGRKELRSLLNWRTKLRRFLARELRVQAKGLDAGPGSSEEEDTQDLALQEEEELDKQLADLKAGELAELKRKKRKLLRERRRLRERAELKMDLPGVSVADDGETCLFSLLPLGGRQLAELGKGDMEAANRILEKVPDDPDTFLLSDGDTADSESMDSDPEVEEAEEGRRREEERRRRLSLKRRKEEEGEGASVADEEGNPLLVHLEPADVRQDRRTSLWFSKGAFAGLETEADEDIELQQTARLSQEQGVEDQELDSLGESLGERQEQVEETGARAQMKDSSDESSSDESEIQEMKKSIGQANKVPTNENDVFEIVPVKKCRRVLDPEGLALGTVIATSKKQARNLVDDSFNRYAFNDPEDLLPDWFVDNELKYRQRPPPFDPAMAAEFKQRWKEINSRPIKKIAEAKARKKKRMLKKLEQVKKKAEAVVNTVDISEREKMAQMRSIYKKAGLGREKREVTYIVSKRASGPRARRPRGVKGHYKVVDPRMKKDARKSPKDARGKGRGRK